MSMWQYIIGILSVSVIVGTIGWLIRRAAYRYVVGRWLGL